MAWKRRARIIIASVVLTLAGVLLALNLMPQEKRLQQEIRGVSPVASARFRDEVSALLGAPVLEGNHVRDLQNGDEIFPAMLRAIRGARRSINFETYIYWSGEVGEAFVEALAERARAGVAVNVLVDWVGGLKMEAGSVDRLRGAGVRFHWFHPLHWYTVDRMNNRTHRKLLVVDGRIGCTGGVGIADEWLGNGDRPDRWRDMHFCIEGPAVAQMQAVFEDNWITTTGEVLLGERYFPALPPAGTMAAHVHASSPDGGNENMRLMYLLAIAAARESIDLQAAYFLPGALTTKALEDALARGVRVRVMMPGRWTDSELVMDASRAGWEAMLDAGAQLYRFQPSLFHNKMMVVDRHLTLVGSANFDERSFGLNDEANLGIYDDAFAAHMTAVFEADLSRSTAVDARRWRQRGRWARFREWLATSVAGQL